MAEFECRLKKYRQLKELTQEQLAEKVGVRRETIMRLEKAQYNPSLKLAMDIAKVFHVTVEELFRIQGLTPQAGTLYAKPGKTRPLP